MWVLGLPRTPKTRVVGHSSLLESHGSTNGHGTAQNSHPRMVGPVRDITNPLHASMGVRVTFLHELSSEHGCPPSVTPAIERPCKKMNCTLSEACQCSHQMLE